MTAALTLAEFARAERRKDCPVCQLPADIREQLREAGKKSISRSTVIAWLGSCGHTITSEMLTVHHSGHHDG